MLQHYMCSAGTNYYTMETLTKKEVTLLQKLNTAIKIQNYLDSIPFNHEESGETCRSARGVLAYKKAHCLEGTFLASCALLLQKKKPLILNLTVTDDDYDHVVTLYKENGYWGAISKTNHAVLGFRDPVYKTVRELAMSYFHEYFLTKNGKKTLLGYSRPIDLRRFGTSWIDSNENLFSIAETISELPYTVIIPSENKKYLRKATKLEQTTASISFDGK